MRRLFNEFFYFSRGERRGILLLMAGILLASLGGIIIRQRDSKPTADETQARAVAENRIFADSLQQLQRRNKWYENTRTGHRFHPVAERFLFNPNTADSTDFRRLGLPAWMASNILKYRRAGGKFRRPDDFKKIYGLEEVEFQSLLPYITIPTETSEETEIQRIPRIYQPITRRENSDSLLSHPDSLQQVHTYIEKYPIGTLVDLNRADTTELKKIPGVGSVISRLIVNYRERLGGYYALEQLEEIRLDYRQLQAWLHIDTTAIRRIPVNRAGIERLRHHPYINFYQAQVFTEYRRKQGRIKNLKPFVLYEEFTAADLERIGHYLEFGE